MKRPEGFRRGERPNLSEPSELSPDAVGAEPGSDAEPRFRSEAEERDPTAALAFLSARAAAIELRAAEQQARAGRESAEAVASADKSEPGSAKVAPKTMLPATQQRGTGIERVQPDERDRSTDQKVPLPPVAELKAAAKARRREERAEVKRFTRRSRRRRAVWLGAVATVAVLALLACAAVFSPLLALRRVEVVGTSRVDPKAVVAAVDGQLGTPIALVDQAKIGRELAAFSLIRSYQLQFAPPDTLEIRVTERTPVVALQTKSGYETLDPAGVVVETSANRPAGLPLASLQADQHPGDANFVAMSEVLLALPSELLAQVDSASAPSADSVQFTIGGTKRVVWGSADDSALKVRVLTLLLGANGAKRGSYDVSSPRSPVFRSS